MGDAACGCLADVTLRDTCEMTGGRDREAEAGNTCALKLPLTAFLEQTTFVYLGPRLFPPDSQRVECAIVNVELLLKYIRAPLALFYYDSHSGVSIIRAVIVAIGATMSVLFTLNWVLFISREFKW